MPELLRAYGEMLQGEHEGHFRVLVALLGAVLLLFSVVAVGAVVERLVKAWKRASQRHVSRARRY